MQQVSDMRPTYQSRPIYKAEVDVDAYYNAGSVRYAADLPIRLKSTGTRTIMQQVSDMRPTYQSRPTYKAEVVDGGRVL